LAAAIALVLTGVASARHDEDGCIADQTTLDQLKAARQATAAFNSIQAAENATYENIFLTVPNMGDHWVNWGLVDGVFEADRPEAMVYADLGNGRLQLVAVEYLAPYVAGAPPAGFSGTCDRWSPFPSPPAEPVFWTLHAWIWHPNMAGTFAKTNPMVP
jgi:hypothetical protein